MGTLDERKISPFGRCLTSPTKTPTVRIASKPVMDNIGEGIANSTEVNDKAPCRNVGEGVVDGAEVGGEVPRQNVGECVAENSDVYGEAPLLRPRMARGRLNSLLKNLQSTTLSKVVRTKYNPNSHYFS